MGAAARFLIRPWTYRGNDGFLLTGPDGNRSIRIFARTRQVAEDIRTLYRTMPRGTERDQAVDALLMAQGPRPTPGMTICWTTPGRAA